MTALLHLKMSHMIAFFRRATGFSQGSTMEIDDMHVTPNGEVNAATEENAIHEQALSSLASNYLSPQASRVPVPRSPSSQPSPAQAGQAQGHLLLTPQSTRSRHESTVPSSLTPQRNIGSFAQERTTPTSIPGTPHATPQQQQPNNSPLAANLQFPVSPFVSVYSNGASQVWANH